MERAEVTLPPKLKRVFTKPARYRGAYGGRGSGKTRTFALMSAIRGYEWGMSGKEGQILCCREHLNSLDESSLEEVKAAIRSVDWLEEYYEIGEKYVRSKDGRINYRFAGLRHNIDSIKSKARILLCWVDEAEPVKEEAWRKLIPTVREEGSEVWVTWNPESKRSATHKRFREDAPEDALIVEMNWRDNPWFPAVLDYERKQDKAKRPEQYEHVWEGDFATVWEGSYFTADLNKCRREGRIGKLNADPIMEIRTYWDIGSTSDKADATAIWVCQFVGKAVYVLDYYEAVGQPLQTHVNWLKDNGYGRAVCVLPHDGTKHENIHKITYQSALNELGFDTVVVLNQGKGAALKRIDAARRVFPQVWFSDVATDEGREALAWYHEKRDEDRKIGLGPDHDWSSHASDAFGMMCQAYEAQEDREGWSKPIRRAMKGVA